MDGTSSVVGEPLRTGTGGSPLGPHGVRVLAIITLTLAALAVVARVGGGGSQRASGVLAGPSTSTHTVGHTTVSPTFGSVEARRTDGAAHGYVATDVGCVDDVEAATLAHLFGDPIGPIVSFDDARVYELGRDRWLWLVQDAFLTYSPTHAKAGLEDTTYVNNVAMLQTETCFTIYHRGTRETPSEFEPGNLVDSNDRWFWPLGGEVHGDRLYVFWSEMQEDGPVPHGDGLFRHPVHTWLASYDPETLERREFDPAPDPGVFPQYGSAVVSDAEHTYLFGNSNLLNLTLEGGFYNGPHSATRMYLARVAKGQFDSRPEYRTADGWSPDPAVAVPISERFWTENSMQPRIVDGQWVAVTKKDGFWGDDVVIDVAEDPWGPWRSVRQWTHEPRSRPRADELLSPGASAVAPGRWRHDRHHLGERGRLGLGRPRCRFVQAQRLLGAVAANLRRSRADPRARR